MSHPLLYDEDAAQDAVIAQVDRGEEATDADLATMKPCATPGCHVAIPNWREEFCRSCYWARTRGECQTIGCHTMLTDELWERGLCQEHVA